LLDNTAQERDAMLALLHSQKGVVGQLEVVGTVQAKLVSMTARPLKISAGGNDSTSAFGDLRAGRAGLRCDRGAW
jgi:hypothetical protein